MQQITAKFASKCKKCKCQINPGDLIWYDGPHTAMCDACGKDTAGMPTVGQGTPQHVTKAQEAKATKAKLADLLAAKKATKVKKPSFAATVAKHATVKPGPVETAIANCRTQKAKGIRALQSAGLLSQAYARVAQNEQEAITAAQAIGFPCFLRPCPVTPRHGFVDSRQVHSTTDVAQVWKEAIEADPEAEAIAMPFIDASHNMVWRPGVLSIGPGHDGATAGHDSVSVYLQPEYSGTWKNLATKAGIDISKADPFVEAVASDTIELVLTQIRGGVKGAPTSSDWIPASMTVGRVIAIDPATKNEPGKMLAWETECKELDPVTDIVWNPGGNLGDHWSVHAQLNKIAIVTTFKPAIGQTLEPCGEQLVELEPQAIVFGFLGGVLSPTIAQVSTNRLRAVCAAILGTHHGIKMGGEAGVFLGASVAFMLRLGQAAIWGEARHAGASKGLGRDQIYTDILDNWIKGRKGLPERINLFHTHHWTSGYGGQAWADCAHATVALDKAMLDLVRLPSVTNAKKLLGELTNTVNCAHNNNKWLDKFAPVKWYDMAADLDPRVALMAGPLWYQSTLAPMADRMTLLDKLESLEPIDLGKFASKVMKGGSKKGAVKSILDLPAEETVTSPDEMPIPTEHPYHHVHAHIEPSKKLGANKEYAIGDIVTLSTGQKPLQAQIKDHHVQLIVNDKGQYLAIELGGSLPDLGDLPDCQSAGGTGTAYKLLMVSQPNAGPNTVPNAWQVLAGETVLLHILTS